MEKSEYCIWISDLLFFKERFKKKTKKSVKVTKKKITGLKSGKRKDLTI